MSKAAAAAPLPDFVVERIKIWDALKAEADAKLAALPQTPIKVRLPDGSEKEGIAHKTTPFDIAMAIAKGLANNAIAAKVDGQLWDLNRPLPGDCTLEILKWDAPEAQKIFWHSSAHILGQALERKFGAHLCTGPPLEDGGFYYDIAMDPGKNVSQDDYDGIKKFVDAAVNEKQPFERLEIPKEQAMEMFKYNKYKMEILRDKVPDGATCTAYRCGPLIDLCRGPHVPNTGKVKAFAVTNNSAAYWKGNNQNDGLQRVYGMSYPDKKQLDEWVELRRLAAERDHRLIGKNQDLFMWHVYSPGSCFMLPKGARIYQRLQDMMRAEYRRRGFQEVVTPNIFNVELWEKSGHWQNYKENMFSFKCEDQDWAIKPMNCPGHCLIFGSKQRSYRELPLRFADFGVLHRNEVSGALTGLTRVRRFQQDDAHIFCMPEQIKQEINGALGFLSHVYGIFGFNFSLELSTMPENHLGDIETWQKAEAALEGALNEVFPGAWKLNPGDGAFYGPKIDIKVYDALKRPHQCATIQLDFQLPRRFELNFNRPDDSTEHPVIIHRAIFGSLERFMAILIEHTGGKWPFWLSPRQCIVMAVSEKFDAYAKKVHQQIFDAGFDCELDESEHLLKKKIRDAQVAQFNFIIVVGAAEEEKGTVNVRTRDNVVHGERTVEQLIEEFNDLVKQYK